MFRDTQGLTLTASDVVNHLACRHLTTLDLRNLEEPLPGNEEDPQLLLLQRKGDAWEQQYLARLKAAHPDLVEIPRDASRAVQLDQTHAAMQSGASIIFQAALAQPGWFGRADFLRRVPLPSALGSYSYEVLDTKLAREAKASHVLQLCFYSWLLAGLQGREPTMMGVVLGDGAERSFRYADYARYFQRLRSRLSAYTAQPPADSYPDPCEKCAQCRWSSLCEAQRTADDHLWQVAGISRLQMRRLADGGVPTFTALANHPHASPVPRMNAATLDKLRTQARLQARGKADGRPCWEPRPSEPARGFQRLPPPSEGDLYFDMEGDPLHEDGLEYLFGVTWREAGELRFRAFWGHTRAGEKAAFEGFMDFVAARLQRYPDLHIYHYAAYENTALKKLMSLHGTREEQVDQLLREHRLVDLYRVVSEGIVASTPSYSIKDIEVFYRPGREGEVKNAGASIVAYEQWRENQDPALLDAIERYNRDDCESTAQLHEWLLGIRPPELPWRGSEAHPGQEEDESQDAKSAEREQRRHEREALVGTLLAMNPADRAVSTADHHLRELTAQLLDFHRRCEKPVWWKVFSCQDMTEQELLDDIECIGGLVRREVIPGARKNALPTWVCEYPEQEFKTREGARCKRVDTLASITVQRIDEANRRLHLKPSGRALEGGEQFSLTPPEPVGTEVLRDAVQRFASAVAGDEDRHRAVRSLLRKEMPRLQGRAPGLPLVSAQPVAVSEVIEAIGALSDSYLFLQGPPGAGKTYTGSRVIVELIRRGHTVGISSNSHKAINNLLGAIVEHAQEQGVLFRGVKKVSRGSTEQYFDGPMIENVERSEEITRGTPLIAGTAWLFADPRLDQAVDFLFVDEAGQVSLGHLVAMGLAARNIVLLGDQMQLPQPIQGVHPGRSGESTLDYLLDGAATIAPERGIFLSDTWRMHPAVCGFISEAVYDGKLHSAPRCAQQSLLPGPGAHAALQATGIRFWPVEHDECSQRSVEETEEVKAIFESLLQQRWRNHEGVEAAITAEDILVVAPYNLQVRLLARTLPPGARVGTVDKFQGQEAAVVIVSMATSSGDYLPRDIEFLYSRNRLNVALSRAKCLAILVASPRLLDVECSTEGQIRLVNTLCWAEEYASRRG
ncbi:MAG TPA: TM0106 family RecB-like putative nuclease [Steroidobacteraceae bacterium]|nr:TM0106 family RecB-like putative nuclease [Steroidobacteraceae bacterium]